MALEWGMMVFFGQIKVSRGKTL